MVFLQLNDQIESRKRKFETGLQNLDKFNTEHVQFVSWLSTIEEQRERLEAAYKRHADDLGQLKAYEAECKNIESTLLSRQADLRFMRINYQNFANLTDLFSKDLQNYCARVKDNRVKRLSTDLSSELGHLKSCLLEADERYQRSCEKVHSLREVLGQLVDGEKQLSALCAKFDGWLTESETRVEQEMAKLADLLDNTNNGSSDHVSKLEDFGRTFQLAKTDVQLQRKSLDEMRKFTQQLLLGPLANSEDKCKRAVSSRSDQLGERYSTIEAVVNKQCEQLFAKLAQTRNLKENLDSTSTWLDQIDRVYLNGSAEEAAVAAIVLNRLEKDNSSSAVTSSSSSDHFEGYDRLRDELQARKELLVKNLSKSSQDTLSNPKEANELLVKIDHTLDQLTDKASKMKSLQALLDKFYAHCDKLIQVCKHVCA